MKLQSRILPIILNVAKNSSLKTYEYFWTFSLDWILNLRIKEEEFENDGQGFHTATIENIDKKLYNFSVLSKDYNKIFPKNKTKLFKPNKCFAPCYVTIKGHPDEMIVGVDGSEKENVCITLVGNDFPEKEIIHHLDNIQNYLNTTFNQSKNIAMLSVEWCECVALKTNLKKEE